MLTFHEGNVGSGKSYEAVVNQIIPALKKGRQVFTNVEGLNFEKFAQVTGISLEKIRGEIIKRPISIAERKEHAYSVVEIDQCYAIEYRGLLHQLHDDQVKTVYRHIANDSLVVLDELQDFFPAGQRKLGDELTQFVTRHRHRGCDIIAMGQDFRDCHNLFKRRIDRLLHFVKRDAVGRPTEYTWKAFKQNQGKFIKLRSGKGSYDPRYFGLYKSHDDGVEKTEDTEDERANLLKSGVFRVGLPVFGVVVVLALYYLVTFFSGSGRVVDVHEKPGVAAPSVATVREKIEVEPVAVANAGRGRGNPDVEEKNYISGLVSRYRPRLSAVIENEKKLMAYVEFIDDGFHVKERLELQQIARMGWDYVRTNYGFKLIRDKQTIVLTSWPVDPFGKASTYTRQGIPDQSQKTGS